ncbi:HD domain-containing protein [Undibacterium fentianense]|uniref:N-methyl-D-aspartate receptor NMDAR2C subunit n=1 Tax=Undibacterium fentianense TaxID=2828728 RepID=A0A941E3J6_9BURK|nr:N-methyl-D-aspartate receptor NMDAR2C subunit [Undibacterium fentianense]MBR7800557.1 N-methyl-D-aspartate receptor NMDAR2C subunit [Undibacterium fentianense]
MLYHSAELFNLSWQRAWSNLELCPPKNTAAKLVAAYSQSHRHYHTCQHLQECLTYFSEVVDLVKFPGEVEIALWFHDAVYELRANDNEKRSADWALEVLSCAGASDEQLSRVGSLIMATCHQAEPSESDQRLLVDIDLSILGANPARFAEYDTQVGLEYHWVPKWIYRSKRKAVLRNFLDRPQIYGTAHFHERLEAQARVNLAACI